MKFFLRLILVLFFFGFTPGEKSAIKSEKENRQIDKHEITLVENPEIKHFSKFQDQAKTVID
ncbi:hypothetical protein JYB64_12085 [Algoriphagus aestuarii]|nr:hypothetical protein [Algoriphagus aestuarii]